MIEENLISRVILDTSIRVHEALGPGLLESVYVRVLAHALRRRGLEVQTEVPIAIRYEDLFIEGAFKADMVVGGKVIVELKSVERTAPVHRKQALTYVRLAGLRLGLLINFGARLIKDDLHRLANGLPD